MGGGAKSVGMIRVTVSLTLSCTAFVVERTSTRATAPICSPVDIIQDFFLRPYSPQMSFTATGLEVTSSGGSLGGLIRSLKFLMNDLYQGASTSATSSRFK